MSNLKILWLFNYFEFYFQIRMDVDRYFLLVLNLPLAQQLSSQRHTIRPRTYGYPYL